MEVEKLFNTYNEAFLVAYFLSILEKLNLSPDIVTIDIPNPDLISMGWQVSRR